MSQSQSREDAELAFRDVRSQFLRRGNAVKEIDNVTRSHEEKIPIFVKRGLQKRKKNV